MTSTTATATFRHPLIAGFVEEAKRAGVPEHLVGQFVQQKYRLAFGCAATVPLLGGITAESQFVVLSDEEADALTKPDGAQEVLSALERRLDEAIAGVPDGVACGAFVKLDSRSPKDALVASTADAALCESVFERIRYHAKVAGIDNLAGRRLPAHCALNGLMGAL
jgi:hypothetical protein